MNCKICGIRIIKIREDILYAWTHQPNPESNSWDELCYDYCKRVSIKPIIENKEN